MFGEASERARRKSRHQLLQAGQGEVKRVGPFTLGGQVFGELRHTSLTSYGGREPPRQEHNPAGNRPQMRAAE